MAITVTSIRTTKKDSSFDLFADLVLALGRCGEGLEDGDVLVVSSKYAALSQGRAISESRIGASAESRRMAGELGMRAGVAETVLRESESVMGGVAGFAMAVTGGIMAPNAGIDTSNAGRGRIILYPDEPHRLAEALCRKAFLEFGVRIGAVLADSRLMPMRAGTCGIAVAAAGFEPVEDRRGEPDLGGRPLVVTKKAAADSIATMANYEMGEGAESTPFAIVRGAGVRMSAGGGAAEAGVSREECIYTRAMARGIIRG